MRLPAWQKLVDLKWTNIKAVASECFECGYCSNRVASDRGYEAHLGASGKAVGYIRICPHCSGPTFFYLVGQCVPASLPGSSVNKLPQDILDLYQEARIAAAAGAFTASVMASRKLLMHIAVAEGAPENQSFQRYVEYLNEKGFIPPRGKSWIDQVRKRGNEANHEIIIMERGDAISLITFLEMLLRFIYEFPALAPSDKSD